MRTFADFLAFFAHFALLSTLSVGGALAAAPEMHRFLVDSRLWLSHQQFADSITLAQAAPGPNILFVTLLGWQFAGVTGALVATIGIMLPSSLITFYGYRLKQAYDDSRIVGAIRLGLSPIAIGLTASAGWVVAVSNDRNWRLAVVTAVAALLSLRARFNLLWLIAAGAVLGAAGVL